MVRASAGVAVSWPGLASLEVTPYGGHLPSMTVPRGAQAVLRVQRRTRLTGVSGAFLPLTVSQGYLWVVIADLGGLS